MFWLWIALAFAGGMTFMWKVAGRILYHALNKRSLILEQSLGRSNYDNLVRLRDSVERELQKRREPVR